MVFVKVKTMVNKNIIRFEFTKKGGLKYISHLDLQRAFARIIKRSTVPIRYTEGFNPHPKMVFGLPLSVGCESECELIDIYMVMDEKRPGVPLYTPEEFKNDITKILPVGLEYVNAYYPDKPFTEIKSAKYKVEIDLTKDDDVQNKVKALLSAPMVVTKKSKTGNKDIDISPFIFHYDIEQKGNSLTLTLELSAAQNEYLNPEYVITGLKEDIELSKLIDYYSITRMAIIFN